MCGVIGKGLVVGEVVSGPHGLADPHVVPLSLKVVVVSSPPSPPPTCEVVAVPGGSVRPESRWR